MNGAQPTAAQMNALIRRVRHWQSRLAIATNSVVGHSERTPTICPGMNMNDFRSRMGGNVQTPTPPPAADQQRIQQILQDLPGQTTNVLGFGSPPGIMNFLPNMTNVIQKKEFLIAPNLIGRITFQEKLATSNPFGFDIKDGQVKNRSASDHAWNLVTQFIPVPSINLLNSNEFAMRLGELVQNGSAILTIRIKMYFLFLIISPYFLS